jgi:hypothetical protein
MGSKSKDSVDHDDLLTQHASLAATLTVGTVVHAEAGGMATKDYERLPVSHYQALQQNSSKAKQIDSYYCHAGSRLRMTGGI